MGILEELMEGGIHSLKGFVYQATVILDEILPHFERRHDARARPEGADDLELEWTESGAPRREFIQIKKPKEDDSGRLKLEPWSLRDVTKELLPNTIAHLRGNEHVQRWVLGDDVDSEVRALVSAGLDASYRSLPEYLHSIHLLARDQSGVTKNLSETTRRSLGQWQYVPPSGLSPQDALDGLIASFAARVAPLGAPPEALERYADRARDVDKELAGILARVRLHSTFGTDAEVRTRVCDRISQIYPISRERVEHTIFGNMRQFVDDIAVRKGTWIERAMLDELVARVWPELILLREPPPLPTPHIERTDLIKKLLGALPCRALEVVGVAGSGKTSLARSLCDQAKLRLVDTDVVYVEVQKERSLREIITGIGFHLRKRGAEGPRDAALRSGITEEERMRAFASALDEVEGKRLVLVDLVQGGCDDDFTRLLSIFLTALSSDRTTLIFFGQESALRSLTQLERELARIPASIEQTGFQFAEFEQLVSFFHPNMAHGRLTQVYQRSTAGRFSGLVARLAYDLARAPSIEVMERIVSAPPDNMVPRAVRERFERIPETLRTAADKLVCMLLPFRRDDAAEIFPEDRIQAAIAKLLDLGLLNHHDSERLEMHETVRRSAEDDVPPARRQQAHRALATWYAGQRRLLAEIHHLDRAGQQQEARRKAREAFLAGEHEYALSDFVVQHELVTATELADSLLSEVHTDRHYMAAQLLRRLGDRDTANHLLAGLNGQETRFDTDYGWAWRMVESILACSPEALYELAEFGLRSLRRKNVRSSRKRFEHLLQGATRIGGRVDSRLLALYDAQDEATKWQMHGLMALDPRREVLERIFRLVETYELPRSSQGRITAEAPPPISLPLRSREEIVAFLGSIPLAEPSAMLTSRSPRLGRLEGLVWSKRAQLRHVCLELVKSGCEEDTVLENALRVLLLLGEESAIATSAPFRGRNSRFGHLSAFLPAMFPQFADKHSYTEKILDKNLDLNDRIGAFAVLSMSGGDPAKMLKDLEIADSDNAKGWRFIALMTSMIEPSEEMLPLLEDALGSTNSGGDMLFPPYIATLGELPGRKATDMLLRALGHTSPRVRLSAATALQSRRSRRALTPLRELLDREEHIQILRAAIVAFMASGPSIVDGAAQFWSRSPDMVLFRCILAGRLRAESEAPLLVATALDKGTPWPIRRAAVLAASRLPFESALAQISGPVLLERSSFTMDENDAFLGHAALCTVLEVEPDEEQSRLFETHGIEAVWSTWYDTIVQNTMFRKGAPGGLAAAKWALERLVDRDPPEEPQALLDDLHVPILHSAVLRGLRMAGKYDLIEEVLRSADSEWLLLRAGVEYGLGRTAIAGLAERLEALVAGSQFPASPGAAVLVENLRQPSAAASAPPDKRRVTPPTLGAADVIAALATGILRDSASFVVSCGDGAELAELVRSLDPSNDFVVHTAPAEPDVSFIVGGVIVGGTESRHSDNNARVRAQLRPAVAAANRFAAEIPWHVPGLSEDGYLTSFLQHLGSAGNAELFYEELAHYADAIIPRLADPNRVEAVRSLVDARLIPHLTRFAGAGTDSLLASFCSLVHEVDDPRVDPLLDLLFTRWHRRFDLASKKVQHDSNRSLWDAFASLHTHPRFQRIPNYDIRLIQLIHLQLRWVDMLDILKALRGCPRSYVRFEARLIKTCSFEHWDESDVDMLDSAADALFSRLLED